jgi:hypothetical protein
MIDTLVLLPVSFALERQRLIVKSENALFRLTGLLRRQESISSPAAQPTPAIDGSQPAPPLTSSSPAAISTSENPVTLSTAVTQPISVPTGETDSMTSLIFETQTLVTQTIPTATISIPTVITPVPTGTIPTATIDVPTGLPSASPPSGEVSVTPPTASAEASGAAQTISVPLLPSGNGDPLTGSGQGSNSVVSASACLAEPIPYVLIMLSSPHRHRQPLVVSYLNQSGLATSLITVICVNKDVATDGSSPGISTVSNNLITPTGGSPNVSPTPGSPSASRNAQQVSQAAGTTGTATITQTSRTTIRPSFVNGAIANQPPHSTFASLVGFFFAIVFFGWI